MAIILRIGVPAEMTRRQREALMAAATEATGDPGPHDIIDCNRRVWDVFGLRLHANVAQADVVEISPLKAGWFTQLLDPRRRPHGFAVVMARWRLDRNPARPNRFDGYYLFKAVKVPRRKKGG